MSEPTTTTTSPMAERSPHQLSAIFPRMGDAELTVLAEDIKANRLKEPIWLLEDKILDGNNRYRACLKIGYPLKDTDFRPFDPKVLGDPLAFVVSANLHRRHLNESQRATIAARLVSTKLGSNQYNRAGVTAEKAAKLLGVSEATVKMAKAVAEKAAPEIVEKVQQGKLRLGAAKQIIEKPKEQQAAELAKFEAEKAAKKAAAEAARKANATASPKASVVNADMVAFDDFQKKWREFTDIQRRAFVQNHESELAGLLENIRGEKALTGGATASVG